jgi:hypothetical protein
VEWRVREYRWMQEAGCSRERERGREGERERERETCLKEGHGDRGVFEMRMGWSEEWRME